MSDQTARSLRDPLLEGLGVEHGFGCRGSRAPRPTAFARQVHGRAVLPAGRWSEGERPEADALVSTATAPRVGIVTADCVPILAAAEGGRVVAAIHAGWRGLAGGVIEAGLSALRAAAGSPRLVAAVGPAARACCYEVDEPVRRALSRSQDSRLDAEVLSPGRDGHFQLDLPLLATRVLEASGLEADRIGTLHRVCTICDVDRFESHRRDGPAAGRLEHFVAARSAVGDEG